MEAFTSSFNSFLVFLKNTSTFDDKTLPDLPRSNPWPEAADNNEATSSEQAQSEAADNDKALEKIESLTKGVFTASKEVQSESGLMLLPFELHKKTLLFLDFKSQTCLSTTCKALYKVFTHSMFPTIDSPSRGAIAKKLNDLKITFTWCRPKLFLEEFKEIHKKLTPLERTALYDFFRVASNMKSSKDHTSEFIEFLAEKHKQKEFIDVLRKILAAFFKETPIPDNIQDLSPAEKIGYAKKFVQILGKHWDHFTNDQLEYLRKIKQRDFEVDKSQQFGIRSISEMIELFTNSNYNSIRRSNFISALIENTQQLSFFNAFVDRISAPIHYLFFKNDLKKGIQDGTDLDKLRTRWLCPLDDGHSEAELIQEMKEDHEISELLLNSNREKSFIVEINQDRQVTYDPPDFTPT